MFHHFNYIFMAKTTGIYCQPRICHCKSDESDPLVKNDLAITPSRMYELTLKGIPITEQTAANAGDFIDGYRGEIDFEPPHVYTRHADIISSWNMQIEARSNAKNLADSMTLNQEGGTE